MWRGPWAVAVSAGAARQAASVVGAGGAGRLWRLRRRLRVKEAKAKASRAAAGRRRRSRGPRAWCRSGHKVSDVVNRHRVATW